MRQFTPLVNRVAGSHHGQASDELFYILTAHGLNAEFCAGAQAFSYLSKEVRQQPRPRWRHPDLARAQATIQWIQPLTQEAIDLENHRLRESWRRTLFNNFLSSSRRDAAAIGHPVYDDICLETLTPMAKLWWWERWFQMLALMWCFEDLYSGLQVVQCRGHTILGAPIAWQCPAFQTSRCRALRDAIQFVLGWPIGQKQHDQAVIKHLADVRSKVLDRR